MTRVTVCCILTTGAMLVLATTASAARPAYRCPPRYWSQPVRTAPVMAAPMQTPVAESQSEQGTYRRYSVEPGADVVEPMSFPTPVYSPDRYTAPVTASHRSTPDNRDIEMRRQRPGHGFRATQR